MTLGPATSSAPPSTVAARYETLRRAALGEALPPEARSGLMLFLSRGMWGWARTQTAPSVREESTPAPSPSLVVPHERKAFIHVLAGLAIITPDRRAL